MKRLAILFLEFSAGLAGNLVAGWIQQDIFSDVFTPLRITGTVIGVIAMLLLLTWLEKPAKKNSAKTVSIANEKEQPYRKQQMQENNESYDVFISHATEDKANFVRPLAIALRDRGHRVWYDEFSLEIGDSLREAVDNGLARSKFGLVVLSKAFFDKGWPVNELNALFARQMEGSKVILPIWFNITKKELLQISPMLADKFALSSRDMSLEDIVAKVSEILKQQNE